MESVRVSFNCPHHVNEYESNNSFNVLCSMEIDCVDLQSLVGNQKANPSLVLGGTVFSRDHMDYFILLSVFGVVPILIPLVLLTLHTLRFIICFFLSYKCTSYHTTQIISMFLFTVLLIPRNYSSRSSSQSDNNKMRKKESDVLIGRLLIKPSRENLRFHCGINPLLLHSSTSSTPVSAWSKSAHLPLMYDGRAPVMPHVYLPDARLPVLCVGFAPISSDWLTLSLLLSAF